MIMEAPEARLIVPLAGAPLTSAVREYVPLLTLPDTFVILNLAVRFGRQATERSN